MTDPQDKPTYKGEVGPDGVWRSLARQKTLNAGMAATFATPVGQEILAYLRSITINAVCGPEVTDAHLRHREGMRFLVGIIEQRIEAHHRDQLASSIDKPDPDPDPADTYLRNPARRIARRRR